MAQLKFTKYEEARIVGARALQIAMGAPIIIDIPKEKLSSLKFSPLEVSKIEFNESVLPLTIKRPLPPRVE